MRGGVYLLAHQAGPGLHDLPLVPGDPESGEEEGLDKDLWSVFYCLCTVSSHMARESGCLLGGTKP